MLGVDVACLYLENVGEHHLGWVVAPAEDIRHNLEHGIPCVAQHVEFRDFDFGGDALKLMEHLVEAVKRRVLQLHDLLLNQHLEGFVGDDEALVQAADVPDGDANLLVRHSLEGLHVHNVPFKLFQQSIDFCTAAKFVIDEKIALQSVYIKPAVFVDD